MRGPRVTIIHLANGGADSRLGISIHGIKSAVRRNRIKRIVREFFRLDRDFISPTADVVFAVRQGFDLDSPMEVRQLVERMLKGSRAGDGGKQPGALSVPVSGVAVAPIAVSELT